MSTTTPTRQTFNAAAPEFIPSSSSQTTSSPSKPNLTADAPAFIPQYVLDLKQKQQQEEARLDYRRTLYIRNHDTWFKSFQSQLVSVSPKYLLSLIGVLRKCFEDAQKEAITLEHFTSFALSQDEWKDEITIFIESYSRLVDLGFIPIDLKTKELKVPTDSLFKEIHRTRIGVTAIVKKCVAESRNLNSLFTLRFLEEKVKPLLPTHMRGLIDPNAQKKSAEAWIRFVVDLEYSSTSITTKRKNILRDPNLTVQVEDSPLVFGENHKIGILSVVDASIKMDQSVLELIHKRVRLYVREQCLETTHLKNWKKIKLDVTARGKNPFPISDLRNIIKKNTKLKEDAAVDFESEIVLKQLVELVEVAEDAAMNNSNTRMKCRHSADLIFTQQELDELKRQAELKKQRKRQRKEEERKRLEEAVISSVSGKAMMKQQQQQQQQDEAAAEQQKQRKDTSENDKKKTQKEEDEKNRRNTKTNKNDYSSSSSDDDDDDSDAGDDHEAHAAVSAAAAVSSRGGIANDDDDGDDYCPYDWIDQKREEIRQEMLELQKEENDV